MNNTHSAPPSNSSVVSSLSQQSDNAPFVLRPAAIDENNLKLDLGPVNTLLIIEPKVPNLDPSRVKRLKLTM